MARKKIRVALWEYRNADGKRRLCYFGDTVELTDAEIERGTAAGVFDQPEPELVVVDDAEPAPSDDAAAPAAPAADAPRRPRATATIEKWAAYAKVRGIDADKVDAMESKDAIIAAVDELDD
ncbi:hypothetical protein [Prescottella equi]|uniref:hypothetical protein n=1 Tax=Rhodococcus hoagii TaxID=43767 RepID=UPI000A112495|nr:hypothetical protein [Prescottella equi]